MVDRIVTEEVNERPRDTVVVKEGSNSSVGWIILAIIAFIVLLFFFIGNPFAGSGTDTDVDVDVPTPTVNTPAPPTPAE